MDHLKKGPARELLLKIPIFAFTSLFIGISLLLSVCSCSPEKSDDTETIPVGFIAPLSGENEEMRQEFVRGARLAVETVNEEGISLEKKKAKIKLIVRDNEDNVEKSVALAQKLINQEDVVAIIGLPFSKNAVPTARITDKSNIPFVSVMSTSPDTTAGKECTYRVCFTDTFQAGVLARFARSELHAETAGVLYDAASIYNSTIARLFMETFVREGGGIVAKEVYISGKTDFTEHLKRIKAARPDLVFLPNYLYDIRRQVTQMRELNMDAAVLGSGSMSTGEEQDRRLLEGAYFSTHFSPKNPSEKTHYFVELYTDKFDADPSPHAALSFDALRLVAFVIGRTKSMEPSALCEGFKSLDRYEGVTGIMDFQGTGDPRKSAMILRYKDGETIFVKRIDPVKRDDER